MGDEYIGCIAQILMQHLQSADHIYRMGGDEFLAVYRKKSKELISSEIAAVNAACEEQSRLKPYKVCVAVGLAMSDNQSKSLKEVLRTADFKMYSEKAKMKQRRVYMLEQDNDMDISGLTDRIFDALFASEAKQFLFITNMTTGVTRWSAFAVDYLGLRGSFIQNCNQVLKELIHPDDQTAFTEDTNDIITGKHPAVESEYRIRNASGEYVNCVCSGTFLLGKNGDPDLFTGKMQIRDASESMDTLTGLRNSLEMTRFFRNLLHNRTPAAIIQLGITNISRINMLYGYASGSEILKQFASVLRSAVGNNGDLFRYDSTKFVISLPDAGEEALQAFYHKICHAAEQEIHLDTITPPVKLAAGAFLLPEDFSGTVSVLQSNLIFSYDRSKYNEHGSLVFYNSAPDTLLSGERKSRLLSIHSNTIGNRDGFYMVYQPIVRFEDKKIIGAEALVRWKSPDFGVVPPGDFIPWLEGDPCFIGLGNWILKQSLTDAKPLLAAIPDFILNVNIAMQQLEKEEFGRVVLDILAETGFPASQLCLELTERCRELNPAFLKTRVDFFRSHGIKIALDDFGTGFSSFGLLLGLQVDEIKLDQTFVKSIRTNRSQKVLTKMLIDASLSLGYTTCLEGVEDEELCGYLKDYNATYYQGYSCSRPVPMEQFTGFSDQWNHRH